MGFSLEAYYSSNYGFFFCFVAKLLSKYNKSFLKNYKDVKPEILPSDTEIFFPRYSHFTYQVGYSIEVAKRVGLVTVKMDSDQKFCIWCWSGWVDLNTFSPNNYFFK